MLRAPSIFRPPRNGSIPISPFSRSALVSTTDSDTAASIPTIFTNGLSALDLDRFAFHAQTTFVAQYDPPLPPPYLGQRSLDPNQGREAGDIMYFAGARLWDGAEFWINPEIIQGFG